MTTPNKQEESADSEKLDEVVQEIIGKIKSQGIFDQFRKECFADVETKIAYGNLVQKVEWTANRFLALQTWNSSLNKNQLREILRKHISSSLMLTNLVERIIDQLVYPKVFRVIKPHIDEVVCEHFGVKYSDYVEQINRKKLKQQQQQELHQQKQLQQLQLQQQKDASQQTATSTATSAKPGLGMPFNPMLPPGLFSVPPPGSAWSSQSFPSTSSGVPLPPMPFAPPGFLGSNLLPQHLLQNWAALNFRNLPPPQTPSKGPPQAPPPPGISPLPLPAQQFPPGTDSSLAGKFPGPPVGTPLPMPPQTSASSQSTPPPPGTELPTILPLSSPAEVKPPLPMMNLRTPPPPLAPKSSLPPPPGLETSPACFPSVVAVPAAPAIVSPPVPKSAPPPLPSAPAPPLKDGSSDVHSQPKVATPPLPCGLDMGSSSGSKGSKMKIDEIPLPSLPLRKEPTPPLKGSLTESFMAARREREQREREEQASVKLETRRVSLSSVSSDESDFYGDDDKPTQSGISQQSSPKKTFNFTWAKDAELSDVAVSSIHTSDLSSFRGSDSSDSDSWSEDEKKPSGKDTSTASDEETSASPKKDSRTGDWQDGVDSMTAEASGPSKPRRLLALTYNYSDSEDEETREERKARIAREKEDRYLRRVQRRTELEAKRKEREEERTKVKEARMGQDPYSTSSGSADLKAVGSAGEGTKKRRRTKEEAKEHLMHQKVMEKKQALRRQRTRNPRYTSEEFTSIFTEKKQPYSSQNYDVEGGVEQTIEIDTTVEHSVVDAELQPATPPTPTQDEREYAPELPSVPSAAAVEYVATSADSAFPLPPAKPLVPHQQTLEEHRGVESLTAYCPVSPYSDISDISKTESEKSVTSKRRRHASGGSGASVKKSLRASSPSEDVRRGGRRRRLKSPELSETRRQSQRYSTDDLYKPRTSRRRPLTPPSAFEDPHSGLKTTRSHPGSSLEEDLHSQVSSTGPSPRYTEAPGSAKSGGKGPKRGPQRGRPRQYARSSSEDSDCQTSESSSSGSSCSSSSDEDSRSSGKYLRRPDSDSNSAVSAQPGSSRLPQPPADKEELEEEGLVRDDEDSQAVGAEEVERRKKERTPIEFVNFGMAEQRARALKDGDFGLGERGSRPQRERPKNASRGGRGQAFRQFGSSRGRTRPRSPIMYDVYNLNRAGLSPGRSPALPVPDGSGSPVKRQFSAESDSSTRRSPPPAEAPRGPRTPSPPLTRRQPGTDSPAPRTPPKRLGGAARSPSPPLGTRPLTPPALFRETRRGRKASDPPLAPPVPTQGRPTRRNQPASPTLAGSKEMAGAREKSPPAKRPRR